MARADPTERYLRLQSALKALQEGYDPSTEWVQAVPGLSSRYFGVLPTFGPAGPERLIAAYRDFLIRQLSLPGGGDEQIRVLELGSSQSVPGILSAAQLDPLPQMETLFDEIERAVPNKDAARYLRSRFYFVRAGSALQQLDPAMDSKARAALLAIADAAQSRYSRLAHAELTSLLFADGDYAAARAQLLAFVERYPTDDWPWVAALRTGQCSERLDEPTRAAEEYRRAATQYSANPLARVLGLTYAANIDAEGGARTQALADYRAARRAWDPDYGPSYSIGEKFAETVRWTVTPNLLDTQIAQLSAPRK